MMWVPTSTGSVHGTVPPVSVNRRGDGNNNGGKVLGSDMGGHPGRTIIGTRCRIVTLRVVHIIPRHAHHSRAYVAGAGLARVRLWAAATAHRCDARHVAEQGGMEPGRHRALRLGDPAADAQGALGTGHRSAGAAVSRAS